MTGTEPEDDAAMTEPTSLGQALDRVLAALGAPAATTVGELAAAWPEIVGARIAAHARPVGWNGGVLVVAVDDPVVATELRYRRAELLDRLADRIGRGVISAIQIRAGPGPST